MAEVLNAEETELTCFLVRYEDRRGDEIVVPDDFTAAFGRQLPNPINLVQIDQVSWSVHWSFIDGFIWFSNGWRKFMVNYELKKSDYLFIKFDGSPTMHVDVVRSAGLVEKIDRLGVANILDIDDQYKDLWTVTLSEAAARKGTSLLHCSSSLLELFIFGGTNVILEKGGMDSNHYMNFSLVSL